MMSYMTPTLKYTVRNPLHTPSVFDTLLHMLQSFNLAQELMLVYLDYMWHKDDHSLMSPGRNCQCPTSPQCRPYIFDSPLNWIKSWNLYKVINAYKDYEWHIMWPHPLSPKSEKNYVIQVPHRNPRFPDSITIFP